MTTTDLEAQATAQLTAVGLILAHHGHPEASHFKVTLHAPAPGGVSAHLVDTDDSIPRMLAAGYTLDRHWAVYATCSDCGHALFLEPGPLEPDGAGGYVDTSRWNTVWGVQVDGHQCYGDPEQPHEPVNDGHHPQFRTVDL